MDVYQCKRGHASEVAEDTVRRVQRQILMGGTRHNWCEEVFLTISTSFCFSLFYGGNGLYLLMSLSNGSVVRFRLPCHQQYHVRTRALPVSAGLRYNNLDFNVFDETCSPIHRSIELSACSETIRSCCYTRQAGKNPG